MCGVVVMVHNLKHFAFPSFLLSHGDSWNECCAWMRPVTCGRAYQGIQDPEACVPPKRELLIGVARDKARGGSGKVRIAFAAEERSREGTIPSPSLRLRGALLLVVAQYGWPR
jgi:hypothetical protein